MGRSQDDKPRQSYVYAIGGDDHRFVKIGYSANPELRFTVIKTGCPLELRILRTWVGGEDLEDALHKRFAHYRRQGEWFEFPADKDVVEFISGAIEEINCRSPETAPPPPLQLLLPPELPPLRAPMSAGPVCIHLVPREAALLLAGERVRVNAAGWEGRPCLTIYAVDHRPVQVLASDPLLPGHLRIFRGDDLASLERVPASDQVEDITPVLTSAYASRSGATGCRDVEDSLWCSCGAPL